MAKNAMGYPLPSGDAFEEDLACMLVFYPDRAAYRQAFFSSLHGLGNWLTWERDAAKGGRDAAQSWKLANELTRECFEMGYCDTMLDLLREIRDNTSVYCCDVVDVSDGDRYTDEIEDGVGDVPQNIIDAGFATDAADWAGFDDYKCIISHLMVQNLKSSSEIILARIDGTEAALITVAALAAIALTIASAGGAILVYGIALSVAGVAGLSAALTLLGAVGLSSLLDNMDDHYDDLVCAIYGADGSLAAVDALKDAIDEHFNALEATYLKSLNLAPQLKALYAGRYDSQDIAAILADKGYDPEDFDCTCIDLPDAPSGYHYEHPVYDAYFCYLNCASETINYDAGTGLLTISVTAGGGGNLEFINTFVDIAGEATFYHAYVWELVDNVSICQFFQVYNGRFDTYPDGRTIGESFAGYNTNQHGGATWNNWVALFDYAGNHSENGMDGIRQRNTVNNCAGYGATHTWVVRVWAVVAD